MRCRATTSITVRKALKNSIAVLFWLLVWQLAAMAANRTLLLPLPTPVDTLRALLALADTADFWRAAGLSLLRVCAGFALAALAGTLCAAASVRWRVFRWLTGPLVGLIRAMPVAVFTIVVFLWVGRAYIPSTIVFLTVLPIVWSGMKTGLRQLAPKLAEMARVFGMKRWDMLRHITLPQLRPYAGTAAVTGLGFAWKSGIAAEVICRTQGSLGDLLWGGKATISYDQVFALAAVIVLCSALLRFAALGLTRKEGGHDPV